MFGKKRLDSFEIRLTNLEVAIGRLSSQVSGSPIGLVYPEPLATPLALEKGASSHMGRYFSMLDSGEAFIKYSWAVGASLLKMSGEDVDVEGIFGQAPTLGRFVQMLREILQSQNLPDNTLGVTLRASFIQPNGKLTSAGRFFLDEFSNIRNTTRGHSASLPDGAYEAHYLRHSGELHDSLEKCTHINMPLVLISSAAPSTERITYDIRHVVGLPPFTRTERIESEKRLRVNGLYVWDQADEFVDMTNLILYMSCPVCSIDHTFFLERTTDNANHYHSYYGNHRCSLRRTRGTTSAK